MAPLFLGPIGVPELLVLLLILVLLFGATKLPLIGRGLGEGIRNFKKGLKEEDKPQTLDEAPASKDSVR